MPENSPGHLQVLSGSNQPQLSVTETGQLSIPSDNRKFGLLTKEAASEMAWGTLPNFEQVCRDLYRTFLDDRAPYSALQFIPVLKQLNSIDPDEAQRFIKSPTISHILVQNDLMKVVLIHWKPGKLSSIHGHPEGGCVFKLLQGSLVEKRYLTKEPESQVGSTTLQQGGMAYIDDLMGYHAVGNPFETSAISLHVYTPGR